MAFGFGKSHPLQTTQRGGAPAPQAERLSPQGNVGARKSSIAFCDDKGIRRRENGAGQQNRNEDKNFPAWQTPENGPICFRDLTESSGSVVSFELKSRCP
jgi:hypothetical protein